MSEMIERAVIAIEDRLKRGPALPPWHVLVRAVIESMREPTEEMCWRGARVDLTIREPEADMALSAAERNAIGWEDHLAGDPAKWERPKWRAMIDAALMSDDADARRHEG